jgi:uncharacterized protein (DUF1786 family)
MRILAVDVGFGTQDILLYDDSRLEENNVKMVLPSMTQILAREVTRSRTHLCFHGSTMGGGPLAHAIHQHIKKGYRVWMTPDSARSVRDDLRQVREMGVEIFREHGQEECRGRRVYTRDVDFTFLRKVLEGVGEEFTFDWVAVAVQDHGYAEKKSDREFRFEKFRESLDRDARLSSLGHLHPPSYYTRMASVARDVRRYHSGNILIIDTKIAAIAGALYNEEERPVIAVDVGNGHTTAAIVDRDMEVLGLFEHHTHMLSPSSLEGYLRRFAAGELTNEEVFQDGGHGCYLRETPSTTPEHVVATGPRRSLLEESSLEVAYASPMGDVMMTGPAGMVAVVKELNKKTTLK